MHVLHISPNFARAEGDPHSPWLVELMQRLTVRGIRTEVLAPAFQGLADHWVYGLQVFRFRYAPARFETLTHESGAPNRLQNNPLLYLLVLPYLASGLLRTLALVRKERYDVIHVHWPVPQILFGLAGKWVSGARLVATSYGADMRMARRMPPVRWFMRRLMRRADALVATSPIVAREVKEISGREAQIIPYWITLPRAITLPPFDPCNVRLLAVGRLIERKGYDYLIGAMTLLPPEFNAHLTIVGKGQERERLEQLVNELALDTCVDLVEYVPDAELARLYDTCSVFVHSSIVDQTGDTESVGMVLLEAMGHARPIVATNVGGIPDVIEDGVTGLLVPEKDSQAIADAIIRLVRDDALAQRLGIAARASIQSQVDWDKSIDAIVRVYEGQ